MNNISQSKKSSIDEIDRRDFMKVGGMITAGVFFTQPSFSAFNKDYSNVPQDTAYTSLTPFIIMDHVTRIARGTDFLSSDLLHSLHRDVDQLTPGNSFYMGINFPFGTNEVVDSLHNLKESSKTGLSNKNAGLLAILSGALVFASVNKKLEIADKEIVLQELPKDEVNIYRDAALIRLYFTKGKYESYDPSELASLFEEMIPRTFIRFHTIMPDYDNGMDWVLTMQDWRKYTRDYYSRMAEVIINPQEDKYHRIITSAGFYTEDDRLMVGVSTFTRLSDIDSNSAGKFSNVKVAGCHASKALAAGYGTLLAIDRFWKGSISSEELNSIV